MKITKGSALPIVNQTAYIRDGWAKCTNLEISLSVPTDIKGEGVIDLTLLSKMKGGYDTAEIRDGFLYVKKGNASSKFALVNSGEEFPLIPACNDYQGVLTEADAYAIADLLQFTGNDVLRPSMWGVYASEKQFAATDAHKMRWYDNDGGLKDVIIPKLACANIEAGVVSFGEETGHKYVEIISASQILNFRPIEEKYPNYEAVIPKDNPVKLIVKGADLAAAVKNALPSAKTNTSAIILIAEKGKLLIKAQDIDRHTEYSEEITAKLLGASKFPISFNGTYLLLCIEKQGETVTFEFSQPNRSAIINGNTLIMPVMIEIENEDIEPVYDLRIGKTADKAAEAYLVNFLNIYRKSSRDFSNEIAMVYSGDSMKDTRQLIVSHLLGVQTPKAQCGITKLEELCKARFDEIIANEPETETAEVVNETDAEPVEETPIQPERKIGEIIIARMPKAEPEPEPEIVPEPEPEPDAEPVEETSEDLPELLTVIENVTEKAFGVVGYTELLPEDFRNKYGSKCKILVGEERREGFLFSKKRRAQLDEAIAEIGIAYHVA